MKNNKALILAMSAGIIASTAAETAYADEIIKNPRLDDDIKLEDESKDQVNTENFFKEEEIADTEAEEIKEEPTDVNIYPPELATIYSELEEEAKIEENETATNEEETTTAVENATITSEEDKSLEISEVETTETTSTPAEPEPDTPIEEENQPAEEETANPTVPAEESQPVEDEEEPAPAENPIADASNEGVIRAETSEDDLQWNNDWNLENLKIENTPVDEDNYEVIGKRRGENYPYDYLNKKYGSDPEFQNRLREAVLTIPDEVINSIPAEQGRESLKKLKKSIKSWQSKGLEGYHGPTFEGTLSAMRDIIGDRSLIDYIKTDYYVKDVEVEYRSDREVGYINVKNEGSQGYKKYVITEGFPSSFFKIGRYFTSEEIRQLVEKNNQYDFQKVSEILLSNLTDEQIKEIFKDGVIKPKYKYSDAINPQTSEKDTTHADESDAIPKELFSQEAVAKKVVLGGKGVEYVDLYEDYFKKLDNHAIAGEINSFYNSINNGKNIVQNNIDAGNLSVVEGAALIERINNAGTVDEINSILKEIHLKYVSDQAAEKEQAEKELAENKTAAKAIVESNVDAGNLTAEEGATLIEEIDKAENKSTINGILSKIHDKYVSDQAAEKEQAEKELAENKAAAKSIVESNIDAGNLTAEEGAALIEEIDKAENKSTINGILSKIHDKYVSDQAAEKELADDKAAGKAIVDSNLEVGNISEEEAKNLKDRIDQAESKEEINSILKEIHEKYVADQAAEKELSDNKAAGKRIVDNNIEAGNITVEEGAELKAAIDQAGSKEQINEILKSIYYKYKEDQANEEELAKNKEAGKRIVDNNIEAGNITTEEGAELKASIDQAGSKEEINNILKGIYDKYKEDQANEEDLSKNKEAGKKIVDNNVDAGNITLDEGAALKSAIDQANSKEEINEILKGIYDKYKEDQSKLGDSDDTFSNLGELLNNPEYNPNKEELSPKELFGAEHSEWSEELAPGVYPVITWIEDELEEDQDGSSNLGELLNNPEYNPNKEELSPKELFGAEHSEWSEELAPGVYPVITWIEDELEEDQDGSSNLGELLNNPEYNPNKEELSPKELFGPEHSEWSEELAPGVYPVITWIEDELEEDQDGSSNLGELLNNPEYNPNKEELSPKDLFGSEHSEWSDELAPGVYPVITWIEDDLEEDQDGSSNLGELLENPVFNPNEKELTSEDIEWTPDLLIDLEENPYPELKELTSLELFDKVETITDGSNHSLDGADWIVKNLGNDFIKDPLTPAELFANGEFDFELVGYPTENTDKIVEFNHWSEEIAPGGLKELTSENFKWPKLEEDTPELTVEDLEHFSPNEQELTPGDINWLPEENQPSTPNSEDIPNPADGESWADDDRELNDYVITDDEELTAEEVKWTEDDNTNIVELPENQLYDPNKEELTADDLFKAGEFTREETQPTAPEEVEEWVTDHAPSLPAELTSDDLFKSGEFTREENQPSVQEEVAEWATDHAPSLPAELTADDLFKSGEFTKKENQPSAPEEMSEWVSDHAPSLPNELIADDLFKTGEFTNPSSEVSQPAIELAEWLEGNAPVLPTELTADDLFKSGEFTRDESIVRPNPIDDKNQLELEFWIEDNSNGINKTDLTADDLFKAGEFSREIPESNLLENNEVGFLSREAALAAGIIHRNSQGLKGLYDVTAARGANGRWFYTLVAKSLEDEQPSNPIIETDQTKALREAKREFQNNVLALNNLTEDEIREFIVKIQGAKTYREVIDAYRQAVELNTLRGINTNKPINPNIPTIEDSIETQIRRAFQENILKLNKLTADEIRYYVLAIQTAKTYEQAIALYNKAIALNASRSISPEAPRDALSTIRELYKNRLSTLTKLTESERTSYAHRMNLATVEKTLESIFLEALVRNNWTTLRPEITPNPILPPTHTYERLVEVKTPDIVYVSTGFDYIKEGFHSFEELEKLRQQLEESIAENKALIETFKKTIKEAEESLNDVIGRVEKVVEKSENLLKDGQKSIKELETVLAKQKEINSKLEQQQNKNEKEKTVKTTTVTEADDSVKPSKTKAQKLAVESTTIYNKAPKAGRKQALRASSQKGYRVPANAGSNPQTGIASVGTAATTMAVAMGSMFAIRKRKEK